MKAVKGLVSILCLFALVSCTEKDFGDDGTGYISQSSSITVETISSYEVREGDQPYELLITIDGIEVEEFNNSGQACSVGVEGVQEFKAVIDGEKLYIGAEEEGEVVVMRRQNSDTDPDYIIGSWTASAEGMTLTMEFRENGEVLMRNHCQF